MNSPTQERMFQILCPEPQNYSERGLAVARLLATVDAVTLSQDEFEERAPNYDAVMVRLRVRLSQETIASCPRLQAIITPTTGLDHIDLDAAQARDIKVFSLKGQGEHLDNITSTAEHTWALLLSLVRNILPAHRSVRENQWHQHQFRSFQLSGKTLGVIGLGRLGTMVARYGVAFRMRVVGYDPYVSMCPEGVARVDTLDEMLSMSDILTVHVPLTKDTIGLIGTRELGLLCRGAYLINTSRGLIVDERALLWALESGYLAGAAVDVLTNEVDVPGGNHPMVQYSRKHENLVITPHIGGASEDAIENTDLFVIRRFEQWLRER